MRLLFCSVFLFSLSCSKPEVDAKSKPASEPAPKSESALPNSKSSESGKAKDGIAALLEAKDRLEKDRAMDVQRQPESTLRFFGIRPGMRVAELAAGGGYTTELLARAVGESGVVYGQNNRFVLDRFAEGPWSARLKTPAMKNVVRVDQELEAPFPPEATDLDAVLMVLFYHDTVWFGTDRSRMNRAVFDALKPGGIFGIVDHSALPGSGTREAKTLHRIEESSLRAELEEVGFVLQASADFLRNPDDRRDWSASPSAAGEKRGTSDRFVLRFVKPVSSSKETQEPATLTACSGPRSSMCTLDYRPVCGVLDTGVRCVAAPCPSTERRTFSNACSACAEKAVSGHFPGACPEKK